MTRAIGFVKGFLTGAISETTSFDKSDFRNIAPRFSEQNRRANQAMVDRVTEIAARQRVVPAQIALAWLLARKPWIVPIPGTTKLHRLDKNLGAASVALTTEDLKVIDASLAGIAVHGDRYPPYLQKLVGR